MPKSQVVSLRLPSKVYHLLLSNLSPGTSVSSLIKTLLYSTIFKLELPRTTEIEHIILLYQELHKIGVNLNQITHAINVNGVKGEPISSAYLENINTLCQELSSLKNKIRKTLATYNGEFTDEKLP